MNHTQGPWRIGNHPSQVVSDSTVINTHFPSPPNQKQSELDEYYGGHLVCESVGNTADAKLIAAAPELLESLIANQKIIEWVISQRYSMWSTQTQMLHNALSETKDAIKKATE